MAEYVNGANDILGGSVIRYNLNTTTPGQAVIRRIIAGNGISITSTGVDSGTGDVIISLAQSNTGGGNTGGGGVVNPYNGTVTSVNMTVPTGMTILGAPITTAGTIMLGLSHGYLIPTQDQIDKGLAAYNKTVTAVSVSGTSTKTLTITLLDGTTLITSFSSENIYNASGTLTGNRVVTMGGNYLSFTGGNVYINTATTPDSFSSTLYVQPRLAIRSSSNYSAALFLQSDTFYPLAIVKWRTSDPGSMNLPSGHAEIQAADSGLSIWASGDIRFGYNNAFRMGIYGNTGNVVIGTEEGDLGYRLAVDGRTLIRLNTLATNTFLTFQDKTTSTNLFTFSMLNSNVLEVGNGNGVALQVQGSSLNVFATAKLGVGVTQGTTLAQTLHVGGSARITGLSGTGTRMVVADADGILSTSTVANEIDTLDTVTTRGETTTNKIEIGGIYTSNSGRTTNLVSELNYFVHKRLSSSGTMGFKLSNGSSDTSFWRWNDANGDVEFGNVTNYGLAFYTNNVVVAKFYDQGYLYIGTSPSYTTYRVNIDGNLRTAGPAYIGTYAGIINNCLYTYITNHCGSSGYIGFGFTNVTNPASSDSVFDIYQGPANSPIGSLFNFKHTLANNIATINQAFIGLTGTINQTAPGAGIIRGFYYNPTITSIVGSHYAWESTSGKFKISDLSGTGTRMVVADSTGELSTQAVPTSVNIYNSNGTLTGNRTMTMSGNYLSFAGGNIWMSNANNNTVILNSGSTSGDFVWGGNNLNYTCAPNGNIIIATGPTHSGKTTAVANIIIGQWAGGSMTTSNSSVFLGYSAGGSVTTGSGNVFIGRNMGQGVTTGGNNVFIGGTDTTNVNANTTQSLHIIPGGYENNDAVTALGSLTSLYAFIGGGYNNALYLKDFFFGGAPFVLSPTNANITFYAPSGTGTNAAGSNFTITPGRGTGTGTGGDLVFSTAATGASGTTVQTISPRVVVKWNTGNVGINYTIANHPNTYKFDVSGTGRFTSTLYLTSTFTTAVPGDAIIISSGDSGNGSRISFGDGNSGIMRWSNRLRLMEYTGLFEMWQTGSSGRYIGLFGSTGSTLYAYSATTTGTATVNTVVSSPTINNTGGTTTVRGFYYNPTVTSVVGTTHFAFESTAGKIKISDLAGTGDRFVIVDSTGLMSTATIGSGLSFSGGVLSATGGAVGTVTGTGTAGKLAKFSSSSNIADSIITESGTIITVAGSVTANLFKTPTGTSSQFLKADGSVDTNVYISSGNLVTDYDSAISGTKNSVNTVFTTTNNFTSGTTRVFINGIRLSPGASNDYVESSANTITFTLAPDDGDILVIDYIKA